MDLTSRLKAAAGRGPKPTTMDAASLRDAAASVSALSQALQVGMESTGKLNQLSMQKEQAERRMQIYEEQMERDSERITKLQERILAERERKTSLGGVFADVQQSRQTKRRVQLLEKELASRRHQQDVCTARSMQLRATINRLREIGVGRRAAFQKLRSQLLEKRKAVIEALRESNELQEDGDMIQQELDELRTHHEEEIKVHKREMDGVDSDIASIHAGTFESVEFVPKAEEDGPGSGDLTEVQEKELRERIHQLDSMMRAIEADIRGLYEQTSQLQEIFQLMLKRAGLATLDDLIEMFSGEESYKFEQYGYIQRVTKELKQVELELASQLVAMENARVSIREAQAKRVMELELRQAEVKDLEAKVEVFAEELATRRRICMSLARLSLQNYKAGGGTNPAVTSLDVLLQPSPLLPVDAEDQFSDAVLQREGPQQSGGTSVAADANDFGLTTGSVKALMSALESRVADNVMVFANLLQRPAERAAILKASQRPGSARHAPAPLERGDVAGTDGAQDDADEDVFPPIHVMEVGRILKSYKAGPLGRPTVGANDGLGLFRLPQLGLATCGGSSRSLMSAFLSAPSVEEVNMDEPDDSYAVLRPLQRAELAESKVSPGQARGEDWAAPHDSQSSLSVFEEDMNAMAAATSDRNDAVAGSLGSRGGSAPRRRTASNSKPRFGSRTPIRSKL